MLLGQIEVYFLVHMSAEISLEAAVDIPEQAVFVVVLAS